MYHPTEKWTKDLYRPITKEYIQMINVLVIYYCVRNYPQNLMV